MSATSSSEPVSAAAATRPVIRPLTTDRSHVVIIGGGFGGLSAAKALRRAAMDVTIVDRRNHHVFQPLLYQVATAGLSPGDIASPIRFILRRQRNLRVLLAEAIAIDLSRKMVELDIGDLAYDFLIVATGSTHAYFGHDEWRHRAPGLKTLEDALTIRRRVLLAFERAERATDEQQRRRELTFVIIGGGPTGVELAGALAEISHHALRNEFDSIKPEEARIVLVEGGPHVLDTFPDSLRRNAEQSLKRLGVEVVTGAFVTNIEGCTVTAGDGVIEAGTVLWAAGVAASPLGRTLGTPVDRVGRVMVGPDLSLEGHPEVFVIGDLAHARGGDGKMLPGVAPVAMQQGDYAARLIARGTATATRAPFRYVDYGNLATIGRASAVADFGWLQLRGYVGWLAWLFIHILKLTGFRNRLVVLVQWAWAYATYQRSIRLITGDDGSSTDACSGS